MCLRFATFDFIGGLFTVVTGVFIAFGCFAVGTLFYGIKECLDNETAMHDDLTAQIENLKTIIESK